VYKQTGHHTIATSRNDAACTSCWRRLDTFYLNNKNVTPTARFNFCCHSDIDNATENNGRTTWSTTVRSVSPLLSILTPIHHLSAPLYALTSDYSYTTVACPRACTNIIVSVLCAMRRAVKIRKLTLFVLSDHETDKAYSTVPVACTGRRNT